MQNLHLADKTLFTQYRTTFKTNIDNAHNILEDSQLEGKFFDSSAYNSLATNINNLENSYFENVPEELAEHIVDFNKYISYLQYVGTYSSSKSYYRFNVVSYTSRW